MRIALVLSSLEAGRLSQNYIGTEHLLLALTEIPDCIACRALTSLGVGLDRIQDAVESVIVPASAAVSGTPTLTPAAKRVLAFAVEEARTLAHQHVGTEHLLLGLLRETEGIAAAVLESLGVQCERVRGA